MKILVIGPIPPAFGGSHFGGVATHIEGLTNALVNKNHSVTLWYHKLQKNRSLDSIEIVANSYIDYLASIFFAFLFLFKKELSYLTYKQRILLGFQTYRLKKILSQQDFNCIHVHSLHNTSSIALKYINKELMIPLVITDHGFWQDVTALTLHSASYKKIKAAVAQCHQLIYISDYAKQQHLKIDFGQQSKLVKIKNPIRVCEKVTKPKKTSDKTIIFFNGLTESIKIKQFDLLLKAIQEDKYLRTNINIVAIANTEAHNYVAQNKFDFEIELYTAIPWNKVKTLYLKSNLFVLPSKSESFGLAYLEALSFGVPIIAFEDVFNEFQSNIPYYLGEPFNSKRDKSAQLAEKIKKALSTPFDYNNVYNALKKAYNWEDNIIHYETIYKKAERS